jgi:hypothetical protein
MNREALLAACLACVAAPAAADSFSYTYLEAGLGLVMFEEDQALFGIEAYEDLGVVYASGGYQISDHVAFEVGAAVSGNDGDRTELTETSASFSVLFPIQITDQLAIAPRVGQRTYELEGCLDNTCITTDDTSAIYGADLRAWAIPRQLEFTAGVLDSTATGSDTLVSLGAALWIDHHSLRLNVAEDEFATQVVVGWRFSW